MNPPNLAFLGTLSHFRSLLGVRGLGIRSVQQRRPGRVLEDAE